MKNKQGSYIYNLFELIECLGFRCIFSIKFKIIDDVEAKKIIKAHARTLRSIPENQL